MPEKSYRVSPNPSRFMQPVEAAKKPWPAWLSLSIKICFSFMAAFVLVTFLKLGSYGMIALITCVLVGLLLLYHFRQKAKFRAMAAARTDATLHNFVRSFDLYQVDPWIVRAVFEQVTLLASEPSATIHPRANDDLIEDLLIDPEDFEDQIWDKCCTRVGREINAEDNPRFGKIMTVRDIVLALQHQPFTEEKPHGA